MIDREMWGDRGNCKKGLAHFQGHEVRFHDLRPLSGNSNDGWGWVRDRERVKFNKRKECSISCTTSTCTLLVVD